MNYWWLSTGILLIAFVILDSLWTTLWVDGGSGPLTSQLTRGVWATVTTLVLHNKHRLLSLSGPLTLILVLVMWIVLLWVGWTLVFSTQPNALMYSDSDRPVTLGSRIYFVGYVLLTLGNGEIRPRGEGWQFATVLATGSGLILITLSISYVLSVISAVVQKRAFAMQITGMGMTPEAVVQNAWDGNGYAGLEHQLLIIASQLGVLTEQLLAYPILQVYHSTRTNKSGALALVILDEALTLLALGVREEHRPAPIALISVRTAIKAYIEAFEPVTTGPAAELPPPPSLRLLQCVGVPTVSDEQFDQDLSKIAERRRMLLGYLQYNHHQWPVG